MADPYSACLPPVRLPENLDKAGKRIYRGLAGGCWLQAVRCCAVLGCWVVLLLWQTQWACASTAA